MMSGQFLQIKMILTFRIDQSQFQCVMREHNRKRPAFALT